MLRLPPRFATIILCFAPLFFQRSWCHAEMLLVGAILTPGRRTVTSILRMTGLGRERRFVKYHRVLNRAAWSGRAAARVLLGLLLDAFVPRGPVILGLDDTWTSPRGVALPQFWWSSRPAGCSNVLECGAFRFFAPPRSRTGSRRQGCPKLRLLPTGSQLSD